MTQKELVKSKKESKLQEMKVTHLKLVCYNSCIKQQICNVYQPFCLCLHIMH